MPAVAVEVIRFVDDSFPGWVEFILHDASGTAWFFVEKVPVLSTEELSQATDYPRSAAIECELVAEAGAMQAPELITIDTSRPWGIEAKDGTSTFVVRQSQLVRE